ncbi:RING finger protein 10 [Histomonas meleagridis]|uniref:RING finger protein 10 n=1 Tax=Histomonas meleagridis TaxID=135588 RepID=UPI00355A799B|nr:RING finger protein 10 [Histomonas meleagridis]KAH0804165.1 RING finger protein 10 [Histomonas meleagridis]
MKKLFKSSEKHLCPVCYESMIESEIVRAKLIYHPDKNESITFTKVKRKLPFNVCTPWNVPQDRLLPSSDPCSIFTHFSIADDKFIEDVYSSELKEIEEQIKIYSEYDETDRIEILTKLKSSLHISPSGHKTAFALTQDTPEDKYVYFYQAADGRLLFPDDLTEKMLLKSFGSIQSAPNSFTAPILTRVTKTIDGTEKNNIFAHLPHGAEVQLALLDLNGIVSPEVIKRYHHLICSRVAPKSPKPKKQTHVITKDDYQTFIPLPQEPQVDLQSEKEFPKFEGISNQLKPKNNNVAKYDLKDEFPAIGQPKPKKPINTSSYSKLKFNTTDEGNLDLKSNYPTLKSTGNTAVKKKQSAWSNLKL